jgi:hypothetical protein
MSTQGETMKYFMLKQSAGDRQDHKNTCLYSLEATSETAVLHSQSVGERWEHSNTYVTCKGSARLFKPRQFYPYTVHYGLKTKTTTMVGLNE